MKPLLYQFIVGGLLLQTIGVIDQSCTKEKICVAGYTATIRPRPAYTNKLKRQQMKDLGISEDPSKFEEDHAISLELCGSPTDPQNLWPEPWPEARQKDKVETYLHRQVCQGKMTLSDAQGAVWPDWRTTFRKVFGKAL